VSQDRLNVLSLKIGHRHVAEGQRFAFDHGQCQKALGDQRLRSLRLRIKLLPI
jgi:hypothetical protein